MLEYGPLLAREKLVAAVYQVLLLHKGPIVKFALALPQLHVCSYVDHWIHFLSNHDVQEFTLSFLRGYPHELPSYFYCFRQLRRLKLQLCSLKPPPAFTGFSRLVSLVLKAIYFDPQVFGSFISNCPLLEELTVAGGSCFGCLEITAVNLKVFWFKGVFESICFKNTPALAVVSIVLYRVMKPGQQERFNLMRIAHSLPALKKLSLGYHFLEFLAVGTIPFIQPSPLNSLRALLRSQVHFENKQQVLNAVYLIKNSPNLQKLKIVIKPLDGLAVAMMEPVDYLEGQDDFSLCLEHLREVKLQLISGIEPELELIRLLLANSPVLKKMEIIANRHVLPHKRGAKILKKLVQFPRASSRAEVKYSDSKDFRDKNILA